MTDQRPYVPESVIPYVAVKDDRDWCLCCEREVAWEHRELPNGCLQTRCPDCHSVSTFGA